ncbi:MAG: arginine--tRNA ligase [Nocardioidaceae bacterium]|nr:arginine--tRNA ligase [Nocardioidaceae bacterium]
MTPEQLSQHLVDALSTLVDEGAVRLVDGAPQQVRVERPKVREHGDYATNIAMQLAKPAGRPPREIASLVADRLLQAPGIAAVDVAGPGFLNIRVDAAAQGVLAGEVLAAGASYGSNDSLAGQRINVEFITANPTGPLHVGHTRWAALGDALGRLLSACGAEVVRESYINDRGAQMDKFGESLLAAAQGRSVPDDGYHGAYVIELGTRIDREHPELRDLPADEQLVAYREEGYRLQLAEQRQDLEDFRTHFDVWYSERTLHADGRVKHGIEKLRQEGHVYEADGALWMRTTDFGDDKDRVLIRSNGEHTYFASDTAYYVDKRERGFDRCIYMLGADHHGYVRRLLAMAACAGDDPDEHIEVLIGQLVKVLRGGDELRLSKRAGTILGLRELVDITGVDALRYTLCRYPADSSMTVDVDAVTRQSSDNPVYYVQYAHARLSAILRGAVDLGIAAGERADGYDPAVLDQPREGDLLRALAELPRVVSQAAARREPHRVARYLEATAATFHRFYDECRVLPMGDEEPTDVHRARLALVAATRVVLGNGLGLLGVSAPERM